MNILITGGNGYIGTHTSIELSKNGIDYIIVDNLVNSKLENLKNIETITGKKTRFLNIDVCDKSAMDEVFNNNNIDGVIHFAGLKAVGESVERPVEYYYNNLVSTMVLIELCLKYQVNKFIFSSSATVYGNNKSPLYEKMELLPATNPYGETKVISERILSDVADANPSFEVTLLRYFNPIGAHESGIVGESPNGLPNNLMPFITKVAKGELEELSIYGDDYETPDGTGVRDYIHVVDLAKGHVAALKNSVSGVNIYNLGTGKGTSVFEIIKAFEEVNNIKISYKIMERRPGDLAECYANVSKAARKLNWKAKKTIENMVKDAWNFEKKYKL